MPLTVIPDSKVHGANMGPIWGRQEPGGPHVGPMNFAIWDDWLLARVKYMPLDYKPNETLMYKRHQHAHWVNTEP